MNIVVKYVAATICILIVAYGAWLVLNTTFHLEEWFQKEPMWKNIFTLLVIVGIIGFLAGILEAKRR
ncbi:MAG: hypothetical protein ACUVRA_06060 [Candidatus Bathyarchaeaceae archaeon]